MQLKLLFRRTSIALVSTIAILSPVAVIAQDDDQAINMSQLTCGEFSELGRMEKIMSVVWFTGWTAQQQGDTSFTPDRDAMTERQDALEASCENKEQDLVINQLVL